MTKKNLMPVVVLTAICIVVAALLGVINMLTAPIIEAAEAQKVYDSFRVVLDGTFETVEVPEGAPKSVTSLYKVTDGTELKGHVLTLVTKGYAGDIGITVGIDKDGKVTKAVVTSESESHGKAGMKNYTDNFAGVGPDEVGEVDTFTGATASSTAIKSAIVDAVNFMAGSFTETEEKLPKTDEEIMALAKELIGAEVELTDVTPEDAETVKRMYKASGNNGYVAYAVVISANYGTVETETLIHISNTGKIVNVNKLVWKTSDAMYGYVPPTEEVVNEFYGRLPGNGSSTIGDVELVTNATSTSTNLMNAIKESLAAADELIKKDMPTDEATIIEISKGLIGSDVELADVTPEGLDFVKKIYKAGAGKGYIAYTVVISANYGTVETETLIHISATGKIESVKKMIWKTSDAMYGYVPPTEDVVDAFYDRLPGNGSATIGEVDLVTNATSTSTNLMNAIKEALGATDAIIANDLPTAEVDIIAAAKEMIGKDIALVDITPASAAYLKRLYKADEEYIAYIVVISQYGNVETETLVHIDGDGRIVSVKKMIWKTSDAMYGYVPPTEEVVDAFYARLPGNGLGTIDGIELATNATSTSTRLIDGLKEALTAADADIAANAKPDNTARIVGIAVIVVAVGAAAAFTAIKRKKEGGVK